MIGWDLFSDPRGKPIRWQLQQQTKVGRRPTIPAAALFKCQCFAVGARIALKVAVRLLGSADQDLQLFIVFQEIVKAIRDIPKTGRKHNSTTP